MADSGTPENFDQPLKRAAAGIGKTPPLNINRVIRHAQMEKGIAVTALVHIGQEIPGGIRGVGFQQLHAQLAHGGIHADNGLGIRWLGKCQ